MNIDKWMDAMVIVIFILLLIATAGLVHKILTKPTEVCIEGECGFELNCISEVTVEISREQGVRVLQQQCLTEGWVRDTPYYKELKKEGYRKAEMKFD